MNITLITPTGYRPEAFELCLSYVSRQTAQQFEWVVVDDSSDAYALRELGKLHPAKWLGIRPVMSEPSSGPTLGRNLITAFARLKELSSRQSDIIFFIEDDDWYDPTYLEKMVNAFVFNPSIVAAGEQNALYYHVPTGQYREMGNMEHSSLCSMAIRSNQIELLIECIAEKPIGFDILFWQKLRERGLPTFLKQQRLVIGIKGLPGRAGIGVGHRPDDSWERDTDDRDLLREFIGKDVDNYRPFYLSR